MKRDPLKQFTALRESLSTRKAALEAELARINTALGVANASVSSAAPARTSAPRAVRSYRRAQNKLSLREAVLTVTKSKALPKRDILDAVTKLGYKFTAKDPLNSLNTLLYTDKHIKNYDGKFGPA